MKVCRTPDRVDNERVEGTDRVHGGSERSRFTEGPFDFSSELGGLNMTPSASVWWSIGSTLALRQKVGGNPAVDCGADGIPNVTVRLHRRTSDRHSRAA